MSVTPQEMQQILRGPFAELVGTGRVSEAIANDRSPTKFTPFRDLWNRIAGDIGITTKRMIRAMTERELASDIIANNMTRSITSGMTQISQMGFMTPAEQEEIQEMIRSANRAKMLISSHPDPQVQAVGMQRLMQLSDSTREMAARLGERANAARDEVIDERRSRGQALIDQQNDLNTQAQEISALLINSIENEGGNTPINERAYQALLQFIGVGESQATSLLAHIGLDDRPTNQRALFELNTILKVRNAGIADALSQIQFEALNDGQQLNVREGIVTAQDVNVPEPLTTVQYTPEEQQAIESGSAARESAGAFSQIEQAIRNMFSIPGGTESSIFGDALNMVQDDRITLPREREEETGEFVRQRIQRFRRGTSNAY